MTEALFQYFSLTVDRKIQDLSLCSIHYKSYQPLNAGTEAFCSVAKQVTSYSLFL